MSDLKARAETWLVEAKKSEGGFYRYQTDIDSPALIRDLLAECERLEGESHALEIEHARCSEHFRRLMACDKRIAWLDGHVKEQAAEISRLRGELRQLKELDGVKRTLLGELQAELEKHKKLVERLREFGNWSVDQLLREFNALK